MVKKTKVFHVEFNEPVDGTRRKNFYFGSLSAIFDRFTPQQIGCKVENLWNLKLSGEKAYTSKTCTISVGEIVRKKQRTQ
ncbi:hypothetical protein [Albibacterium profundi]|uniref:Uncharacterized protein n=1 Tax=Albibacterium profundi TaxID=3134906 RepID=A0ABV5CEY9_9SPHI